MYSVGIAEWVKRICKEVTNYSEENEGFVVVVVTGDKDIIEWKG